MNLRSCFAIAGITLLAVGCNQSDSTSPITNPASSGMQAVAANQLSFRAEYNTTVSLGQLPGQIIVHGQGSGNQLGVSTLYLEEFLNPTVIPNTLTGVVLVFTAANGDEVSGVFAGTSSPAFPPPPTPPPKEVTFEGTFEITGGTGGFTGATGSGRFVGHAGTGRFTGFVAFRGTITLANDT